MEFIPTVAAALNRPTDAPPPTRILLEGNPKDHKILASAALLRYYGFKAPLAFIEFAQNGSETVAIVCAVEHSNSGQRILACQLHGEPSGISSEPQVLFDYQAPCRAAGGDKNQ